MPTKEELRLYLQVDDGGTGDPKQDAALARKLHSVFDVPEMELKAFVRTRDRHACHRISEALGTLGQPLDRDSSARTPQRAASAPSLDVARQSGRERLDDICSMRSTYNAFFTPGGRQHPKTAAPHAKTFDDLAKPDSKGSLQDWRTRAPDAQVRALGDACRSLRCFAPGGLPETSYAEHYPWYEDPGAGRPPRKEINLQRSDVPLGSLNQVSAKEKAALDARRRMRQNDLERAAGQQRETLDGTATDPARKTLSCSLAPFMSPLSSTLTPGEDQACAAPSSKWRSFARDAWTSYPHSKSQVAKHELSRLVRGEWERKEHARREKLDRILRECGGKTPAFDVRLPAKNGSTNISRFSFAKHAGANW